MKNYRFLVPGVLAVLMFLSWYLLISKATDAQKEYDGYIAEARKNAERGAIDRAQAKYDLALEKKSSPELYLEIIEMYRTQGDVNNYEDWLKAFLDAYPTEPRSYDASLEYYLKNKNNAAAAGRKGSP